ncbi:hypothetical protein V8F20_005740 [Naviculisporaceae sp. PSN 640]
MDFSTRNSIANSPDQENNGHDGYRDDPSEQPLLGFTQRAQMRNEEGRHKAKEFLESKSKHYIILAMVVLDVAGILADIFISLMACDLGKKDDRWVQRSEEILYIVGVVFSSLFLVELLVTVWVFGFRFFKDWFHCFDAVIIVMSFLVDILTHGIVEQITSLIIILRLWRLVKIIEELSLGASERMEEIEAKVVQLEAENTDLKRQIERLKNEEERPRLFGS